MCGLFFKMDFPRSKRNKLEYLRILKFLKILLNSFQVKINKFQVVKSTETFQLSMEGSHLSYFSSILTSGITIESFPHLKDSTTKTKTKT